MRKFWDRLQKSLNFNGRDWVAMLLALLLAFSTWFIHRLSLQYTEYLTVKVSINSDIYGRFNVSEDYAEVMARCRTSGYNVLKNRLRRDNVVEVQVDPSLVRQYYDDTYYITSDKLYEYAQDVFGEKVNVEMFVTDTLFFRFPEENHKRVPVVPMTSLTFKDQYVKRGDLVVSPDSVTLYGQPQRLDDIEFISTELIKETEVSTSLNGVVRLKEVSGVRMPQSEVRYSLRVVRFVEIIIDAPVTAVNVPEGKNLIVYPSTVKVALKCELPYDPDAYEDMIYYIDYNDFESSISGKCVVKADNQPLDVIDYEVTPFAVNCVEETL